MPCVGEHQPTRARINPDDERRRKRDIFSITIFVKGVAQLMEKIPLFAGGRNTVSSRDWTLSRSPAYGHAESTDHFALSAGSPD